MAREVIVKTWCDVCLAGDSGSEVEAEELSPLTLTDSKPRTIALCPLHRKELFDPLAQVLEELGQPAMTPETTPPPNHLARLRPVPGGLRCRYPGCEAKPLKNIVSLNGHVRNRHQVSMKEYRETYARSEDPIWGYRTPPPGEPSLFPGEDLDKALPEDDPRLDAELEWGRRPGQDTYPCGVGACGKVFLLATNSRPWMSVAVHRARSHGVINPNSRRGRSQVLAEDREEQGLG